METRSNYVMVGAVTVALLVGVLLFIVWLAGLSSKSTKCYDIYFSRPWAGSTRARTSASPAFRSARCRRSRCCLTGPSSCGYGSRSTSRLRCSKEPRREIHSISLAGANEIQLNGAERGRPPITAWDRRAARSSRRRASGLSALLNSAPELIARIQRLTERLTELLSDKNQNSIADILENIDATTAVLRRARAGDG